MSNGSNGKMCFLEGGRACSWICMAYVEDGKTNCRLINTFEKLVPAPTRPVAPSAPKVKL